MQTIHCPHCQKEIELTEALRHELTAENEQENQLKLQNALDLQARQLAQEQQQKLEEAEKINRDKISKLETQVKSKFEFELKLAQEEKDALRTESQKRQQELLQSVRKQRELEEQMSQIELDMEKKLILERETIQKNATNKVEDQMRLKLAEKDKQIDDAKKANEELTRKLAQGSQQTQGEILELEIEQLLKNEFPRDLIKEVPKGIRGADVIQIVVNEQGQEVGSVLWESKNTKSFQPTWLAKLRSDQRAVKSEIAVLVSVVLPPDIQYFAYKDGIMITQHGLVLAVAHIVRKQLIAISKIRTSQTNKYEKSAIVYQYLSGNEFRHRMEAIAENFAAMQIDHEKEKRFFEQKWARLEKYFHQLQSHTSGMYGDLQGIMGNELPELESEKLLSE